MGYRNALLFRWSRRDRLTVIVVAVTAAFLIGTALLLFTAVTYSETFAEPLSNSATVTYETADGDPPTPADSEIVLPLATGTVDGESVRVVGVPTDAPRVVQNGSASWQEGRFPTLPAGVDGRGPVNGETQQTLQGPDGQRTLTIVPPESGNTFFGSNWYVTNATTADALGAEGYLIIDKTAETGSGWSNVPATGIPLVSALLYVLGGLEQVLWALGIAVGAGGLLVLIVVYSVTRMSVRDRLAAIRVIRSTGGSGLQVGLLFTARAGLLVVTGVALGYAGGLIIIKALVNVAVYLGVPIALDVGVTTQSLPVVGGVAGLLIVMGILAGALAAYPAASRPPARLGSGHQRRSANESGFGARVREVVSPTLLSWRSLIPTAATLAVFALTVLLVTSLAGLAGPLSGDGAGTGTITEADAPHPLNSRLDAEYARALQASGTPASPEIIHAQVRDGQPYMIHGADYASFANVTGATVVTGRAPQQQDEAVIGSDLATTLGLDTGDTITVGGSVSPGVRQYEIVGTYRASGTLDDILIVPLESVWGLSTTEGMVHTIRVGGDVAIQGGDTQNPQTPTGQPTNQSGITVTQLTGPESVARGDNVTATVTVQNFAETESTRTVTIAFQNDTRTETVTLGPNARTTIETTFTATQTGTQPIQVGNYTHTVQVFERDAIRIPSELPAQAPPGSGLYIPVVTNDDQPVTDATVELNGLQTRTRDEGVAVLPVPEEPGTYTITAQKGNRTATHELAVVTGTERRLTGQLTITPQSGNALTSPTLRVEVGNPWQQPITQQLTVTGPGTSRERVVTVDPGNATGLEFTAGGETRTQPGTYTFRLAGNGTTIGTAEYTVTGDERLASAIASSGAYATGTTIERSIEGVFGNVQVILVALIVLAALSTVGSTTATFAQAVHARRQAIGIHRSTGATRGQLLRRVLADVVRIALPATAIGIGIAIAGMHLLERTNQLVFFGFRLAVETPPAVVIGLGLVSGLLALLGAAVALVPYLLASPVTLLTGERKNGDRERATKTQTRHPARQNSDDD